MIIHKTDSSHEDARGLFLCVVNNALRKYADLNYTITRKDTWRGDHYHKSTNEYFFIISGKIKLVLQKVANGVICEEREYIFSQYDAFEIEPYENHIIHCLDDTVWISLLTESFDDNNPDFFKVEK